jgi:hypothetical protein
VATHEFKSICTPQVLLRSSEESGVNDVQGSFKLIAEETIKTASGAHSKPEHKRK